MKKNKNFLIFGICYLVYTSIYIARLNLSMASPALASGEILNESQIGMLGSIFSVVYAFGRLINGYISDKKHPCFMISTGLIIAGISNIFLGFLPPFIGMLLLWGCNAFAQSMLWSSVLCIISGIYDENTAKRKTSLMVTSVAAGNILGILLNTFIINKFGMRFAFIIPGGLTLILCGLFIPITQSVPFIKNTTAHMSMFSLFGHHSIKTALIPALLHGVMKDNISLWMTMFFVYKYKIDLNLTAGFILFIPIIGFVGRLLYPLCYKLCKENEHTVSVFSFAFCAILALPLCLKIIPPAFAALCLAGIYAAVSLINTSMLSIFPIHFVKSGNVASVSGIMDFATYFGAGISSFAYGFLIEGFGYSPMFISWAIVSVISIFALKKLLHSKL